MRNKPLWPLYGFLAFAFTIIVFGLWATREDVMYTPTCQDVHDLFTMPEEYRMQVVKELPTSWLPYLLGCNRE